MPSLEDVQASLREMQTAIQLAPDQSRAYLNMGILQLNAKQSAAAEANFLKAVSLDPKSVSARLALGNFYQQQKRWPEADQQFRQAIQIEPKKPGAIRSLGVFIPKPGEERRCGASLDTGQAGYARCPGWLPYAR